MSFRMMHFFVKVGSKLLPVLEMFFFLFLYIKRVPTCDRQLYRWVRKQRGSIPSVPGGGVDVTGPHVNILESDLSPVGAQEKSFGWGRVSKTIADHVWFTLRRSDRYIVCMRDTGAWTKTSPLIRRRLRYLLCCRAHERTRTLTQVYKHTRWLSESRSPCNPIRLSEGPSTCIYCSVKTPPRCSTNSPHCNCAGAAYGPHLPASAR